MHHQTFVLSRRPAPLGEMLVLCDEHGRLRAVDWQDHEARMHALLGRQYPGVETRIRPGSIDRSFHGAIDAYFAGDHARLDALQIETGGTDFQRQLWRSLRTIPAGQTISYGELARNLGRPDASRAVGQANGANPISIVVPCHRVIGSNASLTGYGGGIARKQWLLQHEGFAAGSERQRPLEF
ncbi:MAG: methylated-DNA--[protein]-cysteine S-methyltransferase [Pseudomonadota bacterium]|nr:methylated-DNA--[protein]-cysteine S-methyltransferase [Pseudomonadota bacterium]